VSAKAKRLFVDIDKLLQVDAELLAHKQRLQVLATEKNSVGKSIIEAVQRGRKLPKDQLPDFKPRETQPKGLGPTVELLKVLLKYQCEHNDVSQKLIASVADLEKLAGNGGEDLPLLRGWRREIFGEDALDLMAGKLSLTLVDKAIKVVRNNH